MPADVVCSKCGGVGWIIVERANVSGAERCTVCQFSGYSERLETQADIPPLYRGASFENFTVMHEPLPDIQSALRAVISELAHFCNRFPTLTQKGLLFVGEPGTGKTHLAVAVIREIMAKWNIPCRFFDYQYLLDRIRSGYDAASNSADRNAYQEALDAPVLVLDDLGAHRVTDWVQDTVTSILTYRCNHQKPLIATTNFPDAAAGSKLVVDTPLGKDYRKTLSEHIGERARSRLFEMCRVIKMPTTRDYRLRNAKLVL